MTAPVLGDRPGRRARQRPHAPARRRAASASGSSSTAACSRTTGARCRDTLVEIWQANAGGRYRHRVDNWPSPLDPNFTGGGRTLTDADGLLPLRHDQAGRLPVGQPPERLAARAHPLQPVRARVHAAARDADVLPRRPAVLPGPDLQLGARRARAQRMISAYDHDATEEHVGARVPVGHRAARRGGTPMEEAHA